MPPFRTRNPYYLRISKHVVLPLFLYLDERHLNWMTDLILQYVLADLRPRILPKLQAEGEFSYNSGTSKKATVDTHRGDTYQFCYFLRKTEPHCAIVKTRSYVAIPPKPPAVIPPSAKSRPGKRKKSVEATGKTHPTRKKPKPKGKGKSSARNDEDYFVSSDEETAENLINVVDDGEPSDEEILPDEPTTPTLKVEDDLESADAMSALPPRTTASDLNVGLEVEASEEKPKPLLQLMYQGFKIFGQCLVVVVEPWPPIRSATRAPSLAPVLRQRSVLPLNNEASTFTGRAASRARTPLFLPDEELPEVGQPTPRRILPPVPLFSEVERDQEEPEIISDDEEGGMMLFSQALNSIADFPSGAVDEDDELDGAVLFGDADETRGF